MAVVNITSVKVPRNDWTDALTFTAASTASDGCTLEYKDRDDLTVVLATNTHASAAKTVTVKKGNGIGGVNDIAAESIAAGATKAIVLDSNEFKGMHGTNKDKVLVIPESTDVKFLVLNL